MAEKQRDQNIESSPQDSNIPPPTDPYVTYQTPYPRSPSHEGHNPFIEFRRLADSAFSSFFSALPRVLGTEKFKQANIRESDQEFERVFDQHAKEFERRIAEMVKARTEEAEGFRKQLEQDWEERRLVNEKRMEEENQRWEMMRRGLEKCPGLRPDGPDAKQEAETELDLYDGLKAYDSPLYKPVSQSPQSKEEKCPWLDGRLEKRCPWEGQKTERNGWLSGLGWDGTRRAKNIPLFAPNVHNSVREAERNLEWQKYRDEEMDPFNDDDHVVPWLILSPYSPLSLLSNTSWGEVVGQARVPEDAKHALMDMPWDEAFEDLMAVHKTGQLPSLVRRLVYWGGPNQWMTDMALRGSLGPKWEEGFMVAALMGAVKGDQWIGFDGLTGLCKQLAGREFRKTATQSTIYNVDNDDNDDDDDGDNDDEYEGEDDGVRDLRNIRSDSLSTLMRNAFEPSMQEVYNEIEELAESIFGSGRPVERSFGARSMPWPSPEQIINAIATGQLNQQEEDEGDVEDTARHGSQYPKKDSWSSSSVTTSSWQSSEQEKPENIISTFTTTTTKTLPDGSTEVKRVLKKRFADGTEESSESTELKPLKLISTSVDATTQTPAEKPKKQDGQNGWFWN